MQSLNESGWSKTELSSELASYLIDHINQLKELDFKSDSSVYLYDIFKTLKEDPKILEAFHKLQESPNIMR